MIDGNQCSLLVGPHSATPITHLLVAAVGRARGVPRVLLGVQPAPPKKKKVKTKAKTKRHETVSFLTVYNSSVCIHASNKPRESESNRPGSERTMQHTVKLAARSLNTSRHAGKQRTPGSTTSSALPLQHSSQGKHARAPVTTPVSRQEIRHGPAATTHLLCARPLLFQPAHIPSSLRRHPLLATYVTAACVFSFLLAFFSHLMKEMVPLTTAQSPFSLWPRLLSRMLSNV